MSLVNRRLYNAIGVFLSPSPSTGYCFSSGNSGVNLIQQLERVQSVNDGWSVTHQTINQLGQLGQIDRVIVEPPTSTLETSWLVSDVSNDAKIGMYVSGDQSALINIVNQTNNDKNYFIAYAPEGVDIYNYTGSSQVIQVTNGYLASWSTEGAVGGLPQTSVTIEGLNWATSTGSINVPLKAINFVSGQQIQGVNYTIPVGTTGIIAPAAIRPGFIEVQISNATIGLNPIDLKIQRYNISVNFSLQNLSKLGSVYAYSKQPQFPVTVSASVTAYVGDLTDDSVANLLCQDPAFNLSIRLHDSSCTGYGTIMAQYDLKQVKLDSEAFTNAISEVASTVTLNYSTQVSLETTRGLFISGKWF